MFSDNFIEGRKIHLQNKVLAIKESFNHQMPEEHLIYKTTKLLPTVEQAILNIENNNYGHCTICGEEISENRLLVRPEAMTCVECQKRRKPNGEFSY